MLIGGPKLQRWLVPLLRYVVGPLAVFFLVGSLVVSLPPAVRAGQGEGMLGTFVKNEPTCTSQQTRCAERGVFTSNDGRQRAGGVFLDETDPAPGEVVAVQHVGSQRVFLPDSAVWKQIVALSLLWLILALAWAWFSIARPLRRRELKTHQLIVPTLLALGLGLAAINGNPIP